MYAFQEKKLCVVSVKLLVNDNYELKYAEMKEYLSFSLGPIILPLPEGSGDVALMSRQNKGLLYVPHACCCIYYLI